MNAELPVVAGRLLPRFFILPSAFVIYLLYLQADLEIARSSAAPASLARSTGKDFNHEIHESGHKMNLLFIFV